MGLVPVWRYKGNEILGNILACPRGLFEWLNWLSTSMYSLRLMKGIDMADQYLSRDKNSEVVKETCILAYKSSTL
jgi:hypothetical protein